jgi:glycogen debranching enzyme
MRENGLIYADAQGKALTWMDAVVNNIPVTPRERICSRDKCSVV